MYYLPVHSLLFVKSIPRIRFEDSKPSFLKALVTCISEKDSSLAPAQFIEVFFFPEAQ
jgi:hypothetical protein